MLIVNTVSLHSALHNPWLLLYYEIFYHRQTGLLFQEIVHILGFFISCVWNKRKFHMGRIYPAINIYGNLFRKGVTQTFLSVIENEIWTHRQECQCYILKQIPFWDYLFEQALARNPFQQSIAASVRNKKGEGLFKGRIYHFIFKRFSPMK